MKNTKTLIWSGAFFLCLQAGGAWAASTAIQGAGSSSGGAIYQTWAQAYQKSSGVGLQFEPSGSTAGLKKIRANATDFGASDIAPSAQELERDGLAIFPVAATGIAPVYNLPKSVGPTLNFTGDVLARIFSGEITQWNHTDIVRLNPDAALPKLPIRVVVRSDGSGSTYHLSDYFSKVNSTWAKNYGVKAQYSNWPATHLQAKAVAGEANAVKDTVGALGYMDFNYIKKYDLTAGNMQTKDGQFVAPSMDGFRRALINSDWVTKGAFETTLTNQPGYGAWPLTMGTYVVVPRKVEQPEKTIAAMRFFKWSFTHGDSLLQEHNFVRLPDSLQASAFRVMSNIQDANGKTIGARIDGLDKK